MLEKLKKNNPHIPFYSVNDPEFLTYGRVLKDFDATALIEAGKTISMPEAGSQYDASIEVLENCKESYTLLQNEIYGEMPIQIGATRGYSNRLNGTEWHIGSEVNVGVTPFVLLLAHQWELVDGKLDSKAFKAFYVAEGETVEVYGTTLHFCPCQVDDKPFNSLVVLPRGTNTNLENTPADKKLFRKNKWIVCYVENDALIARGVVPGIVGDNLTVKGV